MNPDSPDTAPEGPASALLRCVAALVALQGLALLGLAVFLGAEAALGRSADLGTALGITAFSLAGAAALLLVSRGLLVARARWARAPAAIVQLLLLPVSVSLLQSDQQLLGGVLLVWAVAVLGLLLSPSVVRQTTS